MAAMRPTRHHACNIHHNILMDIDLYHPPYQASLVDADL